MQVSAPLHLTVDNKPMRLGFQVALLSFRNAIEATDEIMSLINLHYHSLCIVLVEFQTMMKGGARRSFFSAVFFFWWMLTSGKVMLFK